MTIAHPFEYHRPTTLADAVRLLADYQGKASVLAGGTDLINWLKEDFVTPPAVVDIKAIADLKSIGWVNNTLAIGATTTFSELMHSPQVQELFPLIVEQSHVVACHGVRNRATMVGNICSGVPCCDSGPILLVYDATVQVVGPKGARAIPISQWFVGPKKTSRDPQEIVTRVDVPLPAKKSAGVYVKLGRYRGEDLAQASVAMLAMEDGEIRVAFGSVAPTPIRSRKIEDLLRGQVVTDALLQKLDTLVEAEIAPISDLRATKEYRLHTTKIMTRRAVQAVHQRLAGRGPAYGTSLL
ncbi:MAG TPA: xanthine dehydrogenase family protein subunit M [Candidatus Ozemobacteraceae bacterium]|nr:xanthine dehydrogenase family protein subunit M [Candidatus Ozemobacteraceae bacterium]